MQKIDFIDNHSQDIMCNTDDNHNQHIINNIDYKEDDEKIEKEVIELVEIFNTVQDLVVNQKGIINVIEDSIDNAHEYVVITQDDLDEIEKIKKNMANKKTIMYSVGVIMMSIPITALAGPFVGISFAVLGVGGIKGYSSYKK
jgi:t-SNARE complex subunit (syntaxin)